MPQKEVLPTGEGGASQLCYPARHHTGRRVGEAAQDGERARDVGRERGRIEREELGLERPPVGGGENAAGEQALIRRLRAVIALGEPGPAALLAEHLRSGRKKLRWSWTRR